jgi:hypothetical protein
MTNEEAFKALRAVIPDIRKEGCDAFGNSPSRNGWMAIVIPKQELHNANTAAKKLGLTLYNPIVSSIYGVHRLLNAKQDTENTK